MTWKGSLLFFAAAATTSLNLTPEVTASTEVAEPCAAAGQQCGNAQVGPNCCPTGQYCQPWNPSYYQCRPTFPRCSTPEVGFDYWGNDLVNGDITGLTLPEDCCNRCSSTAGCVAFTFVNVGWDGRPHCYLKKKKKNLHPGSPYSVTGSHCYLKSGTGTRTTNAGAISSSVTSSSASNHIQAKIRSGAAKSRAVNLGGWLVSEYWMSWDSSLWTGVPSATAWQGEYNVMKYLGKTRGTAAFERHRQTWITEADIKEIAATGVLNTVRVPVGHWIIRDATTSPGTEADMYAPGGLKYLDSLINTWGVKYNLAVIISLHAHQGSQNGFEHSSPVTVGTVGWSSSQTNIDNSLKVATFLGERYRNSPAFLGMALMNEPNPPVDRAVLQNYYIQAYRQIRATGNMCILMVSPFLSEQDADHLYGMIGAPQYVNVWNAIHAYFIWGYAGKTEQQILAEIDSYDRTHLKAAPTNNRLFLGEWCMGGPPDQTGIFQNLDNFRELGRKQLAYYNADISGGWAFWSWRHSDESIKRTGWSMRYLIRTGYLKLS